MGVIEITLHMYSESILKVKNALLKSGYCVPEYMICILGILLLSCNHSLISFACISCVAVKYIKVLTFYPYSLHCFASAVRCETGTVINTSVATLHL